MNEWLLWLDLETTGFNEKRCQIIEVAWAMTPLVIRPGSKAQLEIRSSVVYLPKDSPTWEPGALAMHLESGLAALCQDEKSSQPRDTVEREILNQVIATTGPGDFVYLAGSSVRFDRGFLQEHMQELTSKLHYRIFDVSSHRLFMRSMGGEFQESLERPHRAAADLRDTFDLYRKCRRMRFKAGLLTPSLQDDL